MAGLFCAIEIVSPGLSWAARSALIRCRRSHLRAPKHQHGAQPARSLSVRMFFGSRRCKAKAARASSASKPMMSRIVFIAISGRLAPCRDDHREGFAGESSIFRGDLLQGAARFICCRKGHANPGGKNAGKGNRTPIRKPERRPGVVMQSRPRTAAPGRVPSSSAAPRPRGSASPTTR